ncbi:HSP20 family protein [Scopulibacillus daqui]|uniref:HSP20 family protein n=1 Tax=Scopulibacillus daqui TaxID=1469162 RepID=A0ABS2Q0S6_9BACL|nr:Hsp20/alpha crystallin family protein [Scopulibacillus daqui]MBM7645450.1 HSP20 family protein [Scopulibacillus daqui]
MDNNNNHLPDKPASGFPHDFIKKFDNFFANEPHRSILDSIDAFFQQAAAPFMSYFPVDLYETDSEWVVKAEIPGVNKENIHIEPLGDRLRISVVDEQQTEENNDVNNFFRRERRFQRAERIVALPYSIYKQKTRARYHNGILEIRGPKYPKPDNTLEIE